MKVLRIVVSPCYPSKKDTIKTYISAKLRPQIISGWIKPVSI
jgi:hypothetical protein